MKSFPLIIDVVLVPCLGLRCAEYEGVVSSVYTGYVIHIFFKNNVKIFVPPPHVNR